MKVTLKPHGRIVAMIALAAAVIALGCGETRRAHEESPALAGSAHLERAYLHIDRGNLERAMDDLVVAVELMPDSAAPLMAMASIYEVEGDIQPAVEAYRAALALDPNIAFAHFKIGLISKRMRNDYDTALRRFLRAVALDSTQTEYLYQLGDTYHDLERYAEAKENFEKALAADPNHPYAHYMLGDILESHMERLEEGFSEYERAASILPRDPTLRLKIGEAYARHRRTGEALRHLREFLRLAPDSPDAPAVSELVRRIERSEHVNP